jgi:hypothetical protein
MQAKLAGVEQASPSESELRFIGLIGLRGNNEALNICKRNFNKNASKNGGILFLKNLLIHPNLGSDLLCCCRFR